MRIVSIGPIEGGVAAFDRAVSATASKLSSPARLALVYLPHDIEHEPFLRSLGRHTQGAVIGATTGGAAFTERGVSQRGAVAALISHDFPLPIALVKNLRTEARVGVKQAVASLMDRWHALAPKVQPTILGFADAHACDGEALSTSLREETPVHCRHFGGTAGDAFKFTGTKVFFREGAYDNAAVLAALPAPPSFRVDALHGFQAVPDAREMIVTRVTGNVVHELDGKPAATMYAQELTRLGLYRSGDDLLTKMGVYELGSRTLLDRDAYKIRAPLGVSGGDVTFAGSIPQDSVVRIVHASPDALIQAARALSTRVLGGRRPQEMNGALVFDCAARYQLLGDRYAEEVSCFGGGTGVSYVGFASYGELARGSGSLQGFHNTTAVMAAW